MTFPPDKTPTLRLGRKTLIENPRLRLHEDTVRMHSGRETIHWKVDYVREGVGVVPIDPDGKIILGLHYRYCAECWGWEIAAGSVEHGESVEKTARRELEEETGHQAGRLDYILDYYPAPGLGNEHFHIYVGRELDHSPDRFDAEEIYEVRHFEWAEIEELIEKRQVIDGFSLTALLLVKNLGYL